ncbi:hypothetical protein M5K25_010274 [Dendrobium thyrsiflorum]|uniref:Uncharacterized protein n=1 Tax=Dendrobium thyrsiflorum TaxID=117978 RepID=A0ABD0V0H7_DENTH
MTVERTEDLFPSALAGFNGRIRNFWLRRLSKACLHWLKLGIIVILALVITEPNFIEAAVLISGFLGLLSYPPPSPLPNPNFFLSTHSSRPNPLSPSQALGQPSLPYPPPPLAPSNVSPWSSMGDPNVDHGFLYDEQEMVDILHSPFFDVAFGDDRNANEYVDRILYQLTLAIEDQLPQGHWRIIGHPSTSPDLAPNPATSTRGFFLPTFAVLNIPASFRGSRTLVNSCLVAVLYPYTHPSVPQPFPMDPENIQATLDLIVGQLGTVAQQIRNTQADLAEFRRHTGFLGLLSYPPPSPLPNPNFFLSTHSSRPNPLSPSQALGQPSLPYPPPPLAPSNVSPWSSMGDPNVDHGFLYDEQEMVDILHSPFFDVAFGDDRNANEYVDRIFYQLTLAIEDQLPQGHWRIIGHPSTSPDLAPNPATSTRGFFLPTVPFPLKDPSFAGAASSATT